MPEIKLLIIDDDEEDFMIVRDLLDDIAVGTFVSDWAGSYADGAQLLSQNLHDLCLMDYKLGAGDGIELVRQAAGLGFSGPIILLSGVHHGTVDMEAMEAGAVDYLVKTDLTAAQLIRSIRYALTRKEVEHERVERLKAEAENRSKSDFLAHLSHELRTPLSAILGFTELMLNSPPTTDTKAHLKIVHRNGKHLLGLLNDILDLSKIEAGKLDMEIQPVYLASLLSDTYSLIHGPATDRNLSLAIEMNEPLPVTINTDPTRLRQILINLLGNAIKFTDEGEVKLLVSMVNTGQGERIQFAIVDTGIGIPPEMCQTVFEPFVQSRQPHVESRAGTGLGLTISRQLVQRLGGDIFVESRVGRGSRFVFSIDPGDIQSTPRETFQLQFDWTDEQRQHIPQLEGRVLVVDDLQDIRLLIGYFVEAAGLDVVFASNGSEALATIETEEATGSTFDLILMDIHMPELGGMEAANRLRARGFDKPIVALTAAHMKGDEENYLRSGFTAYLSKPIDQHRLHACLTQFMPLQLPKVDVRTAAASKDDKSVLVVEDSEDALEATCALLRLMGWHPITARDATEAVGLVQQCKPGRALVDLNLPDINGYQLSEKLLALHDDLEIIIASGEDVDRERARALRIKKTILKPITLDSLKKALS